MNLPNLFRAISALSLVLTAPTVLGQNDSTPPASTPASPQSRSPIAPALINIDFKGGSLAQFLEVLHTSGTPFNVIGSKVDLASELPPFVLRNADQDAVANSLNTFLLQSQGISLFPTGKGIYTLGSISRSQREFRSFQLAPLLQFQTVDDITAAIRLAWQMDPAHKPEALQLKYHPPTTILLVYGPSEAIYATQEVIKSLKGASPPKENSKPNPTVSPTPSSEPQP